MASNEEAAGQPGGRRYRVCAWVSGAVTPDAFGGKQLQEMARSGRLEVDDLLVDETDAARRRRAGLFDLLFGASGVARYRSIRSELQALMDRVASGSMSADAYRAARDQALAAPTDAQAREALETLLRGVSRAATAATMVGDAPETGSSGTLVGTMTGGPPADGGVTGTVVGGTDRSAGGLQTLVGDAGGSQEIRLAPGEMVHDGKEPRYEVLERLGEGGQGTVFKVRDVRGQFGTQSGIRAVKFQDPLQSRNAERKATFLREGAIGCEIDDANVVRMYNTSIDERRDLVYLVMAFVDGGSLRSLIERHPRGLPISDVERLMRQVLSGLAAIHAFGLTHKDLKPENVLVSATGDAKIADLGLAGLEVVRGAVGTRSYMAPEQDQGTAGVGPAADIYALGKILHELLTGRLPELGGDPITEMRPEAGRFEPVYRKAVRSKAGDRFQSCEEFRAALDKASDGRDRLGEALDLKEVDPTRAFAAIREIAESGDSRARFELATCLFRGEGCARDEDAAMASLTAAAMAKPPHPNAMTELAHRYETGKGCERDPEMARAWRRKASEALGTAAEAPAAAAAPAATIRSRPAWCVESFTSPFDGRTVRGEVPWDSVQVSPERLARLVSGEPDAMFEVGYELLKHFWSAEDPASLHLGLSLAAHWLYRASMVGEGAASRLLGLICDRDDFASVRTGEAQGGESTADHTASAQWYKSAADLGDHEGMFLLALHLLGEQKSAETPDSKVIVRIRRLVDDAATGGVCEALNFRADCHLRGAVPYRSVDREAAMRDYEQSAKADDPEGIRGLGLCLLRGWGVAADPVQAVKNFRRAEKLGDVEARYLLAMCLREGQGVDRDLRRAARLLSRNAQDYRHVDSMREFARCLLQGTGIDADAGKALRWLRRCIDANDAGAMFLRHDQLAAKRDASESERREARDLLQRAAELGSPEAALKIGEAHLARKNPLARNFLQRAAEFDGHFDRLPRAQYLLGLCHQKGFGGPESLDRAIDLWTRAASGGDPYAALELALASLGGHGESPGVSGAEEWAVVARRSGLPEAEFSRLSAHIAAAGGYVPTLYPGSANAPDASADLELDLDDGQPAAASKGSASQIAGIGVVILGILGLGWVLAQNGFSAWITWPLLGLSALGMIGWVLFVLGVIAEANSLCLVLTVATCVPIAALALSGDRFLSGWVHTGADWLLMLVSGFFALGALVEEGRRKGLIAVIALSVTIYGANKVGTTPNGPGPLVSARSQAQEMAPSPSEVESPPDAPPASVSEPARQPLPMVPSAQLFVADSIPGGLKLSSDSLPGTLRLSRVEPGEPSSPDGASTTSGGSRRRSRFGGGAEAGSGLGGVSPTASDEAEPAARGDAHEPMLVAGAAFSIVPSQRGTSGDVCRIDPTFGKSVVALECSRSSVVDCFQFGSANPARSSRLNVDDSAIPMLIDADQSLHDPFGLVVRDEQGRFDLVVSLSRLESVTLGRIQRAHGQAAVWVLYRVPVGARIGGVAFVDADQRERQMVARADLVVRAPATPAAGPSRDGAKTDGGDRATVADAAPLPTADEVFARSIEARGGAKAFASLKTLRTKQVVTVDTDGEPDDRETEEFIRVAPDRMLHIIDQPNSERIEFCFDGRSGWARVGGGEVVQVEQPDLEKLRRKADFKAATAAKPPWERALSVARVDHEGVPCVEVRGTELDFEVRARFRDSDGLLLAVIRESVGREPRFERTTRYEEYREVRGARIPSRIVEQVPGATRTTRVISASAEPVDESVFRAPTTGVVIRAPGGGSRGATAPARSASPSRVQEITLRSGWWNEIPFRLEGMILKTVAIKPSIEAALKKKASHSPVAIVTIDPSGRVGDAKLERGTGDDELDKAILGAIRGWIVDPISLALKQLRPGEDLRLRVQLLLPP